MEAVDKSTLITNRWFSFTKDEAEVLADVLMNHVDWETFKDGAHYEFLSSLYVALEDVRFGS
jgi:hypothetical protein